jgi:hypothetical protein
MLGAIPTGATGASLHKATSTKTVIAGLTIGEAMTRTVTLAVTTSLEVTVAIYTNSATVTFCTLSPNTTRTQLALRVGFVILTYRLSANSYCTTFSCWCRAWL